MSARRLSALIWLDWKLFVNRIRSIRRNPRRLIPWLIFLIWLIPSFINRLVIGSNLGRGPALRTLAPLVAPLGDFVPGLAALALGFAIWRASDRPPAAFQSPADARFVIGAGLDSRAVFTWLSLRTARRLIVGFLLLLVLFQVLYLPWLGFNLLNALAFTVALATFGGIVFGARLLAFNLKRKVPWLPVGGIGWLTGIAGTGAALAMLVEISGTATMPAPIERISAALPPGSWMLSAFHGDLDVVLIGHAHTAVDGRGGRAPIFVQFQAAGSGADLLLERPWQAAIAFAQEAEVDRKRLGCLEHALDVPGARCAGGGVGPCGRPGATAQERRQATGQRRLT